MIFRQTAAILFLCLAGAAAPAFSQDIHLTGTVRDGSASPLSGVSVKLAGLGLAAFTDANGAYAITKDLAALPPGARAAAIRIPACVNGILYFGVSARSGQVCIELFTLLGRHVSTVIDAQLAPGDYATPLYAKNVSAQPYCVRVTIGTSRFLLKTASTGSTGKGGLRRLGDGERAPVLAKQAFAVDTILVSAAGFARARKPVSSYAGAYDFVLEKSVFGLTSPADSAVITGTRKPLLLWSPDVNAVFYDVYLNISRTDYDWTAGGSPLLDNYTKIGDGIPDDSMAAPTLDDRWNYKWYVVSVDAAGNRKNSAVRTFGVYNPTIDTTVADSVPLIGGCRDLDKNGTIEPYENWRLPVGVRVNDLMSRMSKTDKAMQLFFAADRFPGAGWTTYLSSWDLRPAQISAAKAKWGIPIIPTSDFVSGFYTTFPSQGALCATRDLGIIYKCATMQRDEQLIEAFRATLSPTPETGTKVLYSRIGDGCGENADFGAAMIRATICAYQNGPELNPKSILAIPGHWPAGQDDIPFDAVTLQYHLKPWRAAIEAGAAAIMTGLGTNTVYFTNPNGASDNKQMIDFLRDSLHFDGIVCTEFLGSALWAGCLNAGADILGNASPGDVNMASFVNQIPDARIDEACARVLRVKFSLGLFENPYGNADWAGAVLGGANHLLVARTAARESMTLLKNNGELPLALSAGDTLVVAGARANDGNSYAGWGSSFHDTTIWLTIQKQAAARGVVAVYDSALAVHLSAHAAVCILGEGSYTNIPQWGANTVEMPQDQLALLQSYKHAGVPVIAVVIMPRPYALAWAADSADALVAAYRPGDGAGDAVAGLIFGSYAPHGRLPWQLPRSGDQIGTNTETNMLEHWDLPYDIGASDAERQRIRSLIAANMPLNTATGDSLYGAPLYPYGFGIQGWGK
jgi:beta-glucosidase-like glycosyl hydrolase